MGTLLLRSFAHPMELAAVAIFSSCHFSSPSLSLSLSSSLSPLLSLQHYHSTTARSSNKDERACARPSFFVSLTLYLPSLEDGSFSATITPEIFLRLMQELCFRRFARCFAYLPGGQARTHAATTRAGGGVHLQVRLARRGEEEAGLKIGGWTARRYNARKL